MKVVLVAAVSVDGKMAKEAKDSLKWTGKEDKKWFSEISKRAGVVVMGRKTYELIGGQLKGRLMVVMSRKKTKNKDFSDQLWFRNKGAGKIVEDLRKRGYEEVIIGGGSEINRLFLEKGLVDEVWLSVVPILWGKGLDLVSKGDLLGVRLGLIKTEKLGEGGVVLKYRVLKSD